MIRSALFFSVLAGVFGGPVAAQTALNERPGLWIAVPRAETTVMEAPASGPLITSEPAPVIELSPPEILTVVAPPRAVPVPDTRPVPRPRAVEGPVAPELTLEILEAAFEAPAVTPERVVVDEPVVEVAPIEVAVIAPVIEDPPAGEPEPVEPAPLQIAAAPSVRPTPRPQTDAAVAMAEALAARLAADARAIVTSAPRDVPRTEDIAPENALAPVSQAPIPDVPAPLAPVIEATTRAPIPTPSPAHTSAPTPAPTSARVLTPPAVIPVLTAALAPVSLSAQTTAMSAVLLPASSARARPLVQLVAFNAPPLETTPILPRLSPSGPTALDQIAQPAAGRTAPLSAVLLPSLAVQSTTMPRFARSRAPSYDRFPLSALPPSALPEGPYSMPLAIQLPHPLAEANAAVLIGQPTVIPARLPAPLSSPIPASDTPFTDPEAPVQLPAPDLSALARMMDDAMICWRMADLPVEAQWARISVDVALDERNMPSAGSIRLTGFAHVVSGAAEHAYRAAHSALIGCAEASGNEPATAAATVLFDRNGVRLQ